MVEPNASTVYICCFCERFHRGISVSELYHMRDTVEIVEHDGAGRMVALVSGTDASSPSATMEDEVSLIKP